jgi:hypothetical protein
MAPKSGKGTRRGTRKAKERAGAARPKSRTRSNRRGIKRRGARATAPSRPKRTRQRSRKNATRARRAPRTEGSVEAVTFEERFTPEPELAKRAADAMVGDEEPGGSVSTPDHDLVDQWAGALGVERSPDSPVRSSAEVLEGRDRRREGRRPAPKV